MGVRFGKIKKALCKYAGVSGVCESTPEAHDFAIEVLRDYLAAGGEGTGLAKWQVYTKNSEWIPLPADLDVIVKVKIDEQSALVADHWFEFFDSPTDCDMRDCKPLGVQPEVATYPTLYDIPRCAPGYVLSEGGMGCPESCKDSYFIVQGLDEKGQDIYTYHNNKLIHGEYLNISSHQVFRSTKKFSKITGVVKSDTKGYAKLHYQASKEAPLSLLGMYAPTENVGAFKRARILGVSDSCCHKITILGRVKVREWYADDDVVPVSDIGTLRLLAQSKQSVDNNNLQAADFKYRLTKDKIESTNSYARVSENSFDIIHVSAPGAIKTII